MDPLLLAGVAAAAVYLLQRKKKKPLVSGPGTGDLPSYDPDLPKPSKPSGGGGKNVPSAPAWPGPMMSVEQAQAIAAHAVWFGSEGTEPTDFQGRKRKAGQSTTDWLTNYAFWMTYPTAPYKIPSGWKTKAGWKPWVDAWIRINGTVKNMVASAGPHWEK